MGSPGSPRYRRHLRSVVAASAAPYGYTLTLWTTGAVTTHAEGGVPSTLDALLLLLGAGVAFGLVGGCAYGNVNSVLTPAGGGTRVWAAVHLPSVGLSVLIASGIAHLLRGDYVWPLVGFTSTATYLVVLAGQFWLAERRPTGGSGGGEPPGTPAPDASRRNPP